MYIAFRFYPSVIIFFLSLVCSLADFFSKFWFIFIVLAVFVVIVVVFVCACVVNTVRKRSHHSLEINTYVS